MSTLLSTLSRCLSWPSKIWYGRETFPIVGRGRLHGIASAGPGKARHRAAAPAGTPGRSLDRPLVAHMHNGDGVGVKPPPARHTVELDHRGAVRIEQCPGNA